MGHIDTCLKNDDDDDGGGGGDDDDGDDHYYYDAVFFYKPNTELGSQVKLDFVFLDSLSVKECTCSTP